MIEYAAVTQLSQRLEKSRQYAPMVTDFWLHKVVAPALVKEMKSRAPFRSGRLREAIRAINEPGKTRVGPFGVEYNQFVVEGTKPHRINPKNGKLLRFKVGGVTVYSKGVKHPGTKPNPYMQDAAKAVMGRVTPRLTQLQINVIRTGQVPRG